MTDTPQLLLGHHLKILKLPTFLREHDKLARQCATEGVEHTGYLLRLAELELIERERRMVERRIIDLTPVPNSFLRIVSGLGSAPPHTLFFVPLIARGETVAVLEIGLLGPPGARVRELL